MKAKREALPWWRRNSLNTRHESSQAVPYDAVDLLPDRPSMPMAASPPAMASLAPRKAPHPRTLAGAMKTQQIPTTTSSLPAAVPRTCCAGRNRSSDRGAASTMGRRRDDSSPLRAHARRLLLLGRLADDRGRTHRGRPSRHSMAAATERLWKDARQRPYRLMTYRGSESLPGPCCQRASGTQAPLISARARVSTVIFSGSIKSRLYCSG